MNRSKLNKKAIFFSLTALMIGALLLSSIILYSEYTYVNKAMITETRVNTMNAFIDDLKDDMNRGVFTSGFRAIFSLSEFACSNGTYFSNVTDAFRETFMNGTYNGTSFEQMEDSEFSLWINRTKTIAENFNIELNLSVTDISIRHADPWHIEVEVNSSILVKDVQNTATWNLNLSIKQDIPIQGFQDPTYIIELGGGGIINSIEINNMSYFISDNNETGNLSYLANTSEYLPWDGAPSYLMRLEGNLNASKFGIESFVNLQQVANMGIPVKNKTVVDYIYFSSDDPIKHNIKNMPNWFKLDETTNSTGTNHLERYQVEDLTTN